MTFNDPRKKTARERLDILLVERNLAKTKEKAKSLILAGSVLVDEQKIDKPGTSVKKDSQIRLLSKKHAYVGRGALKLIGALDHFNLDPGGFIAIDAGASTGGFTQVLLERGAAKVYAVDVAYGIIDMILRNNEKVVVLDKTNVRYVDKDKIPEMADLITIDLSFISLKNVVPNLLNFLKDSGGILALIKPQFEVGKHDVEKGGLVKDPAKHKRVIDDMTNFFQNEMKITVIGTCESPIEGATGNKEFFIYATKKSISN